MSEPGDATVRMNIPVGLPAPTSRTLEAFVGAARGVGASDLQLSAAAVPFVRIEGALHRFDEAPLAPGEAAGIAAQVRGLAGIEEGTDQDFCLDLGELGRSRVNLHRHAHGDGVHLKLLPPQIPDLASLGLPEVLYEFTEYRVGLVLVTGPANCGKSTTLASLLERVNTTWKDHVVTIEDPIEFVFESKGCNVTQRQVGPHTRSFPTALRAALREDPDVILVSEMRDLETIRTAIVAAETGHLVLGTLHTIDAGSSVNRILDVFPPKEQRQIRTMLSGSLRAVVSQQLLPRQGGGRRVPAYEILKVTPAVAALIRDGRTPQIASSLQTGRRHGMIDLDSRLEEMVAQGLVDRATAARHSKNAERFGGRRQ